jgi:hypothetical protein
MEIELVFVQASFSEFGLPNCFVERISVGHVRRAHPDTAPD